MNNVRKRQVIELVNTIRETLGKGTHRTVTREIVWQTTEIIEELLCEIENSPKKE